MLISWQSTIGQGTSKTADVCPLVQDHFQRLNFVGAPETTRHLCFAALKEQYSDDPDLVHQALERIMENFQEALQFGVKVRFGGQLVVVRLACIACKGDWPWLVEAGLLPRSFRRAAKRDAAKQPPAGLCHFCMAGYVNVPCSDSRPSARWISTMDSAASIYPWDEQSAITRMMPCDPAFPAYVYRPDLFHCWHLGIGQCFASSAMVLLSKMCIGTSITKRFENMSALWRRYCKARLLGWNLFRSSDQFQNSKLQKTKKTHFFSRSFWNQQRKQKPSLLKITKETCGWLGPSDMPEGCWQKGSTTTMLCESCTDIDPVFDFSNSKIFQFFVFPFLWSIFSVFCFFSFFLWFFQVYSNQRLQWNWSKFFSFLFFSFFVGFSDSLKSRDFKETDPKFSSFSFFFLFVVFSGALKSRGFNETDPFFLCFVFFPFFVVFSGSLKSRDFNGTDPKGKKRNTKNMDQFHWNLWISMNLKKTQKKGKKRTTKKWSVSLKSLDFNEAADPRLSFFCRLFLSFWEFFSFQWIWKFCFFFNSNVWGMAGSWEKNSLHFNWLANVYWGMVGISATGAWLEHPDWWWPSLHHGAFGPNKHEPNFQASLQKWGLAECGGCWWNWQSGVGCLEGIWTPGKGISWNGRAKVCSIPKISSINACILLARVESC